MGVLEKRIKPPTVASLGVLVSCFTFSAVSSVNKLEEANLQQDSFV